MSPNRLPLPVVVLGPTGSGKSELALALAEEFRAEIINFDSVQVYRHLNVGSAKLPLEERRQIPHHLLDILDPLEELTAGSYARRAHLVLQNLAARGKTAILVGGTGLYLRALLQGLSPAGERDVFLRQKLKTAHGRRPLVLHRLLRRLHRETAERIHPNDTQKLIRAIEIRAHAQPSIPGPVTTAPMRAFKIGLHPARLALYRRLDERSAYLFQNGLLDETADLLAKGVPPQSKVFTILGYRQAYEVLTGHLNYAQALLLYQARTRQYAKRQMTWFRRETDVHWLSGFGFDSAIHKQALALVRGLVSKEKTDEDSSSLLA